MISLVTGLQKMTESIEAFRQQKKAEMTAAPVAHLHDARRRTFAAMSMKASTLRPATQRLVDRAIAASRDVVQSNPGYAEIEAQRELTPIDASRLHSPAEQPAEHSARLDTCAHSCCCACLLHVKEWCQRSAHMATTFVVGTVSHATHHRKAIQ